MQVEDLMPIIVSPDRIAHLVPDKSALDSIVARLNLGPKAAIPEDIASGRVWLWVSRGRGLRRRAAHSRFR